MILGLQHIKKNTINQTFNHQFQFEILQIRFKNKKNSKKQTQIEENKNEKQSQHKHVAPKPILKLKDSKKRNPNFKDYKSNLKEFEGSRT